MGLERERRISRLPLLFLVNTGTCKSRVAIAAAMTCYTGNTSQKIKIKKGTYL
jgi:hypothetical protein